MCDQSFLGAGDKCLFDANCGFCGARFYRGFGAALGFACLALISGIVLAVCYWRDKAAKRPQVHCAISSTS
jgi:hypothetical protein